MRPALRALPSLPAPTPVLGLSGALVCRRCGERLLAGGHNADGDRLVYPHRCSTWSRLTATGKLVFLAVGSVLAFVVTLLASHAHGAAW